MAGNFPESSSSGRSYVITERPGNLNESIGSWMDVDADDDDDDMPPLVEKPSDHDEQIHDQDEDDGEDGHLPGISVESYSALPSGGYTFIADGNESSAGVVSTSSFLMPGALTIHHETVGPTTRSQYEYSFSINTSSSHSNSSSAPPLLTSPMTEAGEFATTLANDIASAPRGRTKHHLSPDASGSGEGDSAVGGGYIPRPPNAFILFRSSFIRSEKISGKVEGNHSRLSKIIGMVWRGLSSSERAEWEAKAQIAQDEHRLRYPDWRFRPGSSKNNTPRGRGRRSKGGGRKGRLKTKDGGGEEDSSAGPDDVAASPSKGKEKEQNIVPTSRDVKGKGRERTPESPRKISILIPHAPPSMKRPYHLRSGSSRSSVKHSEPTLQSPSPRDVNPSTSTRLKNPSSSTSGTPISSPSKLNAQSPSKDDLRFQRITKLLSMGKEGQELERELEIMERREDGQNSSDTERGSNKQSWSPDVPSSPPSDWAASNTPSSVSTVDTDNHAVAYSDPNSALQSPYLQQNNTLKPPDPQDNEPTLHGRKRSSSAPAPAGRVLRTQGSQEYSEMIGDRNSDSMYLMQSEDSSISPTWNPSYESYLDGYEQQPQLSPSPTSSLMSPQLPNNDERQWTYPPYNLQQYEHSGDNFSRHPFHKHTRTRSHLNPIQSSSEGMLLSPGSHTDPTLASHQPHTPSSAPPGIPCSQAERPNQTHHRRGSIAFPISPSRSREEMTLPRNAQPTLLTWEAVETQRRQSYQEDDQSQQYTHEHERMYPPQAPDTRGMGWMVSQPRHDDHTFHSFSPTDSGPSSAINWEPAEEGRQGMVASRVDPYLLDAREERSDVPAASGPPPASTYSSLSGWAGEPVVRIAPPNSYRRKDDIWEVDDQVGFGFGFRRGG